MSANKTKTVQLGFADEQEGWLLKNRFFPSKIGGFPAWLELENIPDVKDLSCDYCDEPCIFLCQVYAGSEDTSHAFHRSVFVFICKNGKCCSLNKSGNVKVLRSQLRLNNSFYPDTPADDTVECGGIESPVKVCRVCGCRGPLVCGKCKKVSYCGQLHQKIDWKTHKTSCGSSNQENPSPSEILFPEFEIVIEQEEQPFQEARESEKEAEKRRLREYEAMVKADGSGAISEISEAELNEFTESKEDKTFGKFKKAIEGYETQVLRYGRRLSPLWISDSGILHQSDVPNCGNCNSRRTFEFQIMPQMLNELKNYDLDWGVIAVYTCEKDCDVKGKYVAEFCYKQDIVKGDDEESETGIDKLALNSPTVTNEAANSTPATKPSHELPQRLKKSTRDSKPMPSKPEKKIFVENDNWE